MKTKNQELVETIMMKTKLDELLWTIENLESELMFLDKDNPDVDFLINT